MSIDWTKGIGILLIIVCFLYWLWCVCTFKYDETVIIRSARAARSHVKNMEPRMTEDDYGFTERI